LLATVTYLFAGKITIGTFAEGATAIGGTFMWWDRNGR
jgi:hypothetical protein